VAGVSFQSLTKQESRIRIFLIGLKLPWVHYFKQIKLREKHLGRYMIRMQKIHVRMQKN